MTVAKWDAKKDLKILYSPPKGEFEIVDVPSARFFMIDGAGDPNTAPAYHEAIEALFALSYALKFLVRKQQGRDYIVPPLEAQWWADDMRDFSARKKDRWLWTAMIRIPDFVENGLIVEASASTCSKKDLPGLGRFRVATLDEGRCVQTLHIGSYDDEGPVLQRLHAEFLPQHGLTEAGHHHEIYLSDARRVEPAKLRTILRQPVRG